MNTFRLVTVICCLTVAICEEYFDISKNGNKEWRLVFKGVSFAGSSVYQAYNESACTPKRFTSDCLKPVSSCPCCEHYKNDEALENWSNIDQVAFVLYKDNVRVKDIIFNGGNSTNITWFQKSNIVSTSFGGLSQDSTTNYFSIKGDERYNQNRRFFINQLYGGCHADCGWFVAVDTETPYCEWEEKDNDGYPVLLYSKKDNGCVIWQTERDFVGRADYFVIYIKYQN